MKLVTLGGDERDHRLPRDRRRRRRDDAGVRRRGADGGAQARPGRHRGDPPDERGRARDHAVNGANMIRTIPWRAPARPRSVSRGKASSRARCWPGGACGAVDVRRFTTSDRSASRRAVRVELPPANGSTLRADPHRRDRHCWRIWLDGADAVRRLNEGMDAGHRRCHEHRTRFDDAVEPVQASSIAAAPDFADLAWNKRATVYYLMERYEDSVRDIERHPRASSARHFGAISGMGLIFLRAR